MAVGDFNRNSFYTGTPARGDEFLPEQPTEQWAALKKRTKQWRALFGDRLKREGRWDAFLAQVQHLRSLDSKLTWMHGFDGVAPEFGFVSMHDEIAVLKAWLFEDAATFADKMVARQKSVEEAKQRRLQRDQDKLLAVEAAGQQRRSKLVTKATKDLKTDNEDLPRDVAWVYHHSLLRQAQEGERGGEGLLPTTADLDQAPSAGSVSMLLWAVQNVDKFMKVVIETKMAAARKGKPNPVDENGDVDADPGIGDLAELLKGL